MSKDRIIVNVVRWLGEGIQSVVTPTQKGQ